MTKSIQPLKVAMISQEGSLAPVKGSYQRLHQGANAAAVGRLHAPSKT